MTAFLFGDTMKQRPSGMDCESAIWQGGYSDALDDVLELAHLVLSDSAQLQALENCLEFLREKE